MRPPIRQMFRRGLRFRCPNCGEGTVFSGLFRIRDTCPVCGLSFNPESGYYAGAMYLDYGLSAGIFLLLWVPSLFLPDLTRLSYTEKNLLWIAFAAILCLALARPSYSLWLAIDFWISPWKATPPAREEKKDETLEVPLLSLTIRSGEGKSGRGTPHDSDN
jgi:uncharacterized protein (DUF983 family)